MSKRKSISVLEPIGYAKRLSSYDNKGVCGSAELEDSAVILEQKVGMLIDLIRQSSCVIAHTGAGISTAAGIPDFRGAKGIWTLEEKGEPLPDHEPCWNNAVPTLTHMALKGLHDVGKLQGVVTQNIDGLHARSGLPEDALSELHGNIFVEVCEKCNKKKTRTFDVGGVGFNYTGRSCSDCGGPMIDNLLDWEDELPEEDYDRALEFVERSKSPGGLALCLGTSLQMDPCRHFPTQAHRMVVVNLQSTPMDGKASLVIHARADEVMRRVMQGLALPIPVYCREVEFEVGHELNRRQTSSTLRCFVHSQEGLPCGFISQIQIMFPNTNLAPASSKDQPFSIHKRYFPKAILKLENIHCAFKIFWEKSPTAAECLIVPNPYTIEHNFQRKDRKGSKQIRLRLMEVNYNREPDSNCGKSNKIDDISLSQNECETLTIFI